MDDGLLIRSRWPYCYTFFVIIKAPFLLVLILSVFIGLVSKSITCWFSCLYLFRLKLFDYWGCSFFSILISTSFRWHVVIRMIFIVFVYIQIWCIPFHYHLHFFDQTVETGTNVRVFVPTVSNKLISVLNGEKKKELFNA